MVVKFKTDNVGKGRGEGLVLAVVEIDVKGFAGMRKLIWN
jgi:hypothetical protein